MFRHASHVWSLFWFMKVLTWYHVGHLSLHAAKLCETADWWLNVNELLVWSETLQTLSLCVSLEETESCGRSAGSFIIHTDPINPTHSLPNFPEHCWSSLTTERRCCCRELWAHSSVSCSLWRKRSAADGLGRRGLSRCWEDKVRRSAGRRWVSTLQPLRLVVGKQGFLCALPGVRATGCCSCHVRRWAPNAGADARQQTN